MSVVPECASPPHETMISSERVVVCHLCLCKDHWRGRGDRPFYYQVLPVRELLHIDLYIHRAISYYIPLWVRVSVRV